MHIELQKLGFTTTDMLTAFERVFKASQLLTNDEGDVAFTVDLNIVGIRIMGFYDTKDDMGTVMTTKIITWKEMAYMEVCPIDVYCKVMEEDIRMALKMGDVNALS